MSKSFKECYYIYCKQSKISKIIYKQYKSLKNDIKHFVKNSYIPITYVIEKINKVKQYKYLYLNMLSIKCVLLTSVVVEFVFFYETF